MNKIKAFIQNEDGMGTIEVIIIVAVLVGLALFFKDNIMKLAEDLWKKVIAKTGEM